MALTLNAPCPGNFFLLPEFQGVVPTTHCFLLSLELVSVMIPGGPGMVVPLLAVLLFRFQLGLVFYL